MPGIRSLLLMIFFCNNTGALPVEKTVDDLDKVLSEDKWNVFNKRGLHMIHLNINSVLSKIEELRVVARKSKAAVIGVTEWKLDVTVLDGKVNIDWLWSDTIRPK